MNIVELVVHNINIMSMIPLGVKYHILHLGHVIEIFFIWKKIDIMLFENLLWKNLIFFGNVVENKIFICT